MNYPKLLFVRCIYIYSFHQWPSILLRWATQLILNGEIHPGTYPTPLSQPVNHRPSGKIIIAASYCSSHAWALMAFYDRPTYHDILWSCPIANYKNCIVSKCNFMCTNQIVEIGFRPTCIHRRWFHFSFIDCCTQYVLKKETFTVKADSSSWLQCSVFIVQVG